MTRSLRYTLVSLRELLVSAGPLVLLTIGLLAAAYVWLQPNPPKRVVLATGPENGAYDRFGKAYAQALARYGISPQQIEVEITENICIRNPQYAIEQLNRLWPGVFDLQLYAVGSPVAERGASGRDGRLLRRVRLLPRHVDRVGQRVGHERELREPAAAHHEPPARRHRAAG